MKNPIGIFDSGLGGLTVVAELRRRLPQEWFVYFGDTARVPYGCKSAHTVRRFAMQALEFLLQFDPKIIVAGCNTASAMALEALKEASDSPVIGVIEPGARAAVAASAGGCIAVIGTETTIGSRAYHRAIWGLAPQAPIVAKACPLLASMVEEGRGPGDAVVKMVLEEYLAPLKQQEPRVLLLGCTHYPLLREALAEVMGPAVQLIDSAASTADRVAQMLSQLSSVDEQVTERTAGGGLVRCYVSDNAERFACLGAHFLGEPLKQVSFVPLDALITDPGGALGVMASSKEGAEQQVGGMEPSPSESDRGGLG